MTPAELFSLQGQTALVTGGSRGLGLQMAEALGQAGATVLITARKADELAVAKAHLEALDIVAFTVAADASDPDHITHIAAETQRLMGGVDILVNNAGASWGAPAETHPLAAWDKVMNLNVRGYFLLAQAVANASMLPRQRGCIINIASIAGLGGNPAWMQTIAYNTSKGAVVNFTRALACEWGHHGITVNAIAPGFFPSKMSQVLMDSVGVDAIAKTTPLQRVGGDDDLKGATLLFASAAGRHITGQILPVDGGVSALIGG